MRIVLALLLACATAAADPLPAGSLSGIAGMASGTGADAHQVGYGFMWGAQAAWQPMDTGQRVGWGLRWSLLFGRMLWDSAADRTQNDLRLVLMDAMIGVRLRPWSSPRRYLSAYAGADFLRSNQNIPPKDARAFFGAVATVGIEQRIWGLVLSFDVRYGFIADRPQQIAALVGVGF